MFVSLRGHTIYTPPLASGPVVLDLGANRGAFSRDVYACYGGSCHLVEANPELAAALAADGRFPVLNYAVTDGDGSVAFNIANNDEGSSLLTLPETSAFHCTLRKTVEVQGRRLDSLIAEFGLDRIDLMKMDVEGVEGVALASLSDEALKSIGQITVEFHSKPVFGFDVSKEVQETIARMRALGFLVMDFSNGALVDVLMLNREFHGIGAARAAALHARGFGRKWARSLWRRLPPPARDAVRRALKRG